MRLFGQVQKGLFQTQVICVTRAASGNGHNVPTTMERFLVQPVNGADPSLKAMPLHAVSVFFACRDPQVVSLLTVPVCVQDEIPVRVRRPPAVNGLKIR